MNLAITKNGETGKISIDEANYVPVYMYRAPYTGKLQRYKLLDIRENIKKYEDGTDTSLSQTTYNTLKESLDFTTKILGDEIIKTEAVSNETISNENTSHKEK